MIIVSREAAQSVRYDTGFAVSRETMKQTHSPKHHSPLTKRPFRKT
jgi:hypothetical protein